MKFEEKKVINYKLNINEFIRVRLYDKGYQILADLHNWAKRDAEYYRQQADKDGYTTFQLWVFMSSFGEVTKLGLQEYYDTDILIAAKDITHCL